MSSTFQIAFVSICGGQNHITVDATVQGVGTKRFTYEVDDIRDNFDVDEARRIVRDVIRMHLRGLTLNQAKTEMQSGFTITI